MHIIIMGHKEYYFLMVFPGHVQNLQLIILFIFLIISCHESTELMRQILLDLPCFDLTNTQAGFQVHVIHIFVKRWHITAKYFIFNTLPLLLVKGI